MGRVQAGGEAGHTHRTPAVIPGSVVEFLIRLHIERPAGLVHAIDRVNAAGPGLVVEEHELSAEARTIGLGHTQCERHGHRGIHRIAPGLQYLRSGRRRLGMPGHHHAMGCRDGYDLDRGCRKHRRDGSKKDKTEANACESVHRYGMGQQGGFEQRRSGWSGLLVKFLGLAQPNSAKQDIGQKRRSRLKRALKTATKWIEVG